MNKKLILFILILTKYILFHAMNMPNFNGREHPELFAATIYAAIEQKNAELMKKFHTQLKTHPAIENVKIKELFDKLIIDLESALQIHL